MTEDELIAYIKGTIAAYYDGSQKAFADRNDLSAAYVSDVLSGKRSPGEKILKAIQVQRVVTYKRLEV